jgi:hypothetical protein
MVEEIFTTLSDHYQADKISAETTYYFSLGTAKKTITLSADSCRVEEGKTIENADCVCKMKDELFLRVWNDGYRPGMMDFVGGAIKSNNPQALAIFLSAFGKG